MLTQAWVEKTAPKIQLVFNLGFSDVSQRPFCKEIFIERENKYTGFLFPSPPVGKWGTFVSIVFTEKNEEVWDSFSVFIGDPLV